MKVPPMFLPSHVDPERLKEDLEYLGNTQTWGSERMSFCARNTPHMTRTWTSRRLGRLES